MFCSHITAKILTKEIIPTVIIAMIAAILTAVHFFIIAFAMPLAFLLVRRVRRIRPLLSVLRAIVFFMAVPRPALRTADML